MMMSCPQSCDTFVVMPSCTKDGVMIFGKNSDRPAREVQEILVFQSKSNEPDSKVECTYIELDQIPRTNSTILSKPSWMWGAEMGANEYGVVIGNEAIWGNIEATLEEKLLGMDLVRLALERATTAYEAMDVIIELLEKHGQGGPCSDISPGMCYSNSFLIADGKEAWVLETVEMFWAAEKVTTNYRQISNNLSIGTNIDRKSKNLEDIMKALGLWNGVDVFNFREVMEGVGAMECNSRVEYGKKLLDSLTKEGQFNVESMFKVLRDEESGICMCNGSFVSTSSQVSILNSPGNVHRNCHWFTGTPNPQISVFKPFFFANCPKVDEITSKKIQDDPAKKVPRFSRYVDREHTLLKTRNKVFSGRGRSLDLRQKLRNLEHELLERTTLLLPICDKYNLNDVTNKEADKLKSLFYEGVAEEIMLCEI